MQKQAENKIWKYIKDFAETIIISLLIAIVIKTFIIDTRVVPTASMLPTIQLQDRLLVNKLSYKFGEIERGDVVVFKPPPGVETPKSFFFPADLVKRAIGLPGEIVEVKKGSVYINGEAIEEHYLNAKPDYNYGPVTVPSNKILVLGDNRNESYDSHYWGFLNKSNVKGRVFAIYWPINHLTLLK